VRAFVEIDAAGLFVQRQAREIGFDLAGGDRGGHAVEQFGQGGEAVLSPAAAGVQAIAEAGRHAADRAEIDHFALFAAQQDLGRRGVDAVHPPWRCQGIVAARCRRHGFMRFFCRADKPGQVGDETGQPSFEPVHH
jgi:hypothetical protein